MSSIEKKKEGILPSSNPSPTPTPGSQQRNNKVWLVVICFLVSQLPFLHFWYPFDQSSSNTCPQAGVLIPEKNAKVWTELNDKIGSGAFKKTAIDWLAGAIRIP